MSGDYFTAYLHQNYLEFFSSIEDVVSASDYISDADYLTIDWVVGLSYFSILAGSCYGSLCILKTIKMLRSPDFYLINGEVTCFVFIELRFYFTHECFRACSGLVVKC